MTTCPRPRGGVSISRSRARRDYELEFDTTASSDAFPCAEIVGPNGGAFGGCADASCACGAIVVDDSYASEFAACSTACSGNIAPCAIGLNPGGGLQDVDYTVTLQECLADAKLDFMISSDLSGSFGDDVSHVRSIWPSVLAELSAKYDTHFGVSSFVDWPYYSWGSGSDYAYALHVALTDDEAATQTAIDAYVIRSGGDGPESSLYALYRLATDAGVGWRDGIKIVLITTDYDYHHQEESSTCVCYYPSVSSGTMCPGTFATNLKSALAAANIVPIFAVTSSVFSTYEALVAQLGIGDVVTLSSDSSNFLDVVHAAVTDVCKTVALRATSDPEARVTVNPGAAFHGEHGAQYTFSATVDTDIVGSEYSAPRPSTARRRQSPSEPQIQKFKFAVKSDSRRPARADADGLELATCVYRCGRERDGCATECGCRRISRRPRQSAVQGAADEGVWTEVDARSGRSRTRSRGPSPGRGRRSPAYAFLKTPGADDGSLAFSVRAGVVDGAPDGRAERVIAPTTPSPSPACASDESLYIVRLADDGGDGWEGATYRRQRRHGRRRGERRSTTARRIGVDLPARRRVRAREPACSTTTTRRSARRPPRRPSRRARTRWSLVGIPSRSMSFPTALYTELFTAAELSGLLDEWAVGETWSLAMRLTSNCSSDQRFGFSGGGGFLVLTAPAGATRAYASAVDEVKVATGTQFAVRSGAAATEPSACVVTAEDITLCDGGGARRRRATRRRLLQTSARFELQTSLGAANFADCERSARASACTCRASRARPRTPSCSRSREAPRATCGSATTTSTPRARGRGAAAARAPSPTGPRASPTTSAARRTARRSIATTASGPTRYAR